ncbi:hypothetical protein GCM10009868_39610 [Terrabacter aerolatus]|uniref:Uncharacterized protein n=1 Tax=Terrabacter aerolatus TaxID=422442 RepID=A0A512D0B6_9MICO|nr:hypothetical protein TAE01_17160 [Terrabacter aerolatus]
MDGRRAGAGARNRRFTGDSLPARRRAGPCTRRNGPDVSAAGDLGDFRGARVGALSVSGGTEVGRDGRSHVPSDARPTDPAMHADRRSVKTSTAVHRPAIKALTCDDASS